MDHPFALSKGFGVAPQAAMVHASSPMRLPRVTHDPRLYQIGALAGLLVYGIGFLGFDVSPTRAAVTLGAALVMQGLGAWCTRQAFAARSALITGFSLCLLLRAESHTLAVVGAAAAVGSKFLLRWRGKHVWNPANLGLAFLLVTAGGRAWVSPGQWGAAATFGFAMVCLGALVVTRAARADVALGFLACHAALLFARSGWLGEPMAIPLHRLGSGALLLFTFFMISDPRTTPDSRAGRLVFAALVALGAAYVQFKLFRPAGIIWSLAACAPLVPLIDWLLPGARHHWPGVDAASAFSPALPIASASPNHNHETPQLAPR